MKFGGNSRKGNSRFWFDSWTGLGALYHATGPEHQCDERVHFVNETVENREWNEQLIRELVPGEIVDPIVYSIQPPNNQEMGDHPWWRLETKREIHSEISLAFCKKVKRS